MKEHLKGYVVPNGALAKTECGEPAPTAGDSGLGKLIPTKPTTKEPNLIEGITTANG